MKRRGLIRLIRSTLFPPPPHLRRFETSPFYTTFRWKLTRIGALILYGTRCLKCHKQYPDVLIHIDHIIPRSWRAGPEHDPRRTQPLCADCNAAKGASSMADYRPRFARWFWSVKLKFEKADNY